MSNPQPWRRNVAGTLPYQYWKLPTRPTIIREYTSTRTVPNMPLARLLP